MYLQPLQVMALFLLSRVRVSSCFSPAGVAREGIRPSNVRLFGTPNAEKAQVLSPGGRNNTVPRKLLVHWRGEDVEGYSLSFRHPEFLGSLSGLTGLTFDGDPPITFQNALSYDGEPLLSDVKLRAFNESLQWMTLSQRGERNRNSFTLQTLTAAARRSALVVSLYEVVSEGDDYSELCKKAIENGGFNDVMVGGENEHFTWAVRVRQYGGGGEEYGKDSRHSDRTRSVSLEKDACLALKPMLLKFGGGVDLQNPGCKIYVFDGLKGRKALTRKIASGPRFSSIAPNTRICVTTTPLEPLAAFSLCNIAGIRDGQRIFDPYAGSCAILLAAAMIAGSLQQVGVDSAHDGLINREHIRKDFDSRGLCQPSAVLRGDSIHANVRDEAKAAVGDEPFDHIITDPPYGVRERIDADSPSPLEEMFRAIKKDRERGKPLLKHGGRLVCFVPCHPERNIVDVLPSQQQADEAGMKFLLSLEQPLNSKLSRWLVAYECTV